MKIPEGHIYLSYDADGMGRKVGRAILANDLDELRHISQLIEAGHALVQRWVKDREGVWINGGGDEGNASVGAEYINELELLRKDYEYLVGATISIGVGGSPSEAGRALLIAKLKGKNRIVKFGRATEREIKAIRKRAKKGAIKSVEEMKLADAYLNKSEQDCPYCQKTDGIDPDHCVLCHEQKNGAEDCPFCLNDPSMGPKEGEVAEEDCAFCKEKDQAGQDNCPYCNGPDNGAPGLGKPEITDGKPADESKTIPALVSPDSNNQSATAGSPQEKEQAERMGMNPPEIGKPDINDHAPIGQNAPMDVVPKGDDAQYEDPNQRLDDQRNVAPGATPVANPAPAAVPGNAGEGAPAEPPLDPDDNHSKQALTSIANQIKDEGTPTTSQMDAIGEEDIGSGMATEGNVSRPEGFNQNTPSDMGEEGPNGIAESATEDGPDFGALLEEGLDGAAGEIAKQRAVQKVSQALVQFKGCKDILEQNKMQMPQLYQASIAMLQAMIEMAGVLQLGGASGAVPAQAESTLGQEQQSLAPAPEENEWHDPFPAHPDHGGEAKPGHAPSTSQTNADGTGKDAVIGQGIGKLPTKSTTEHVARTPMPIGGVNAKGQQKVMDNAGKVRFIDMKQGMVQGASGVPVKPPKR